MGVLINKVNNIIHITLTIIYQLKMAVNTIRFKILFLVTSIVLLLMVVTGTYFYTTISKNLTDNADREFTQMLNQINGNIESQLGIIDSTLLFFTYNPIIREYLEKETPPDIGHSQAMKKTDIEKQLSYMLIYNYLWDSKLIKSVYIFENENTYYNIERNDLTAEVSLRNNTRIFEIASKNQEELQIIAPSPSDRTLYFANNMKSKYSLDYIGTIIVAIDVDSMSKVYNGIYQYKGAQAFITDRNDTVLLHTVNSMLGEKINNPLTYNADSSQLKEVMIDCEAYLAASKSIKKYNLTSIIAVPKKQVFANLSENIVAYFKVILFILLVFLVLSILLSSKVVKPIKDLMKIIEQMRQGNFTVKMPMYKDLELNQLSGVYNKMTDEIQYLINDVYKKQLLLKESELKSLQSQINPHFLFNVLDTISWHARAAKNDDINNIVSPLARILRANITMGSREKVMISEELQYIEFYLSIQRSRFGDRLETEIKVSDESIKQCLVPKLCIQPLVENAIVHGLEEKISGGKLTVNIYLDYGIIVFEIIDNGTGFNPEDFNLDSSENPLNESEKHTHIGLYNSNKRIKLLYGDEYGISILSKINEGTRITVRIPEDNGGT